jgi:hypothetical protein
VVEDLVEALPLILEINGSLAKAVHLLLLLAAWWKYYRALVR